MLTFNNTWYLQPAKHRKSYYMGLSASQGHKLRESVECNLCFSVLMLIQHPVLLPAKIQFPEPSEST